MRLITKFIYDHGVDDYRGVVMFCDGEGKNVFRGKDVTVKGKDVTMLIGTFKDGKLNGIGAKIENGVCVEAGLYEDGTLVDDEVFKAGAKMTVIPKTEKYGRTYFDSELYFHEGKKKNVSGYTLLCCETLGQFFISEVKRIKGEQSCYVYAKYENNEPVGMIAFKNWNKQKGTGYDYLAPRNDDEDFLWNQDADRRFFEWKAKKVPAGTTELAKGYLTTDENVTLYLPRSLQKMADGAVSSPKHYYMEVFYEGTKEEWDQMEKGRRESYTYEDFYGYYYHNSERYVQSYRFLDWAKNATAILVHCLNGDILTKDRSFD